jgi:hypothetical protein
MAKEGDAALSPYQHLVRVQQGRSVYVRWAMSKLR